VADAVAAALVVGVDPSEAVPKRPWNPRHSAGARLELALFTPIGEVAGANAVETGALAIAGLAVVGWTALGGAVWTVPARLTAAEAPCAENRAR